jgi:WD40 repeat protein
MFVRSPSVQMGNISFRRRLGEGVVCVCEEGGCVAGCTRALCLFGRLQSKWATYRFGDGLGLVKVWSVSARKVVASLAGHTCYNAVRSVAFSPDGRHIVSGSDDNLVKVWSVSARKEVASLAGHTNDVKSVAYSSDGQHIVSGSSDNLVQVWSLAGRRLRRWLDTRVVLGRSPSVQMGNILFREVMTSWYRCGREWNFIVLLHFA